MRSKGMTLIELMVALAIVGLVTAGVLGVVTNLSRGQGSRQQELLTSRMQDGLQKLVRMDFLHAANLQRNSNGFSFTSTAGLAKDTNALEHFACEVRYEIKTVAERNWLFRGQKNTATSEETLEAVCADIKEIQIEIPDETEENRKTQWETLPKSFVVYFVYTDTDRQPFSVSFHNP